MRLILALLIASLGGGAIGFRLGFGEGVAAREATARRITPPWQFEEYYADPATRPAGDLSQVAKRPPG